MTNSELTWGLDMSTSPRKTAAVAIQWTAGEGARIVDVRHPLKGTNIAGLISDHRDASWAVDVPFGWPDLFVQLMGDRHERPLSAEELPLDDEWETWRTKDVAQRRTDAFLTNHDKIKTRPLPASFQLLGATAAMWALIESRLLSLGVAVDRAGINGTLCETYPRAAMAGWAFIAKSKADWEMLRQVFGFLTVEPELEAAMASDDVCDAVVCSLVARARDRGLTIGPRDHEELSAARREGWIHVTTTDPKQLMS